MINIDKYKEEFSRLEIYNKEDQLEILNSLMRFAIIAQNNYYEKHKYDGEERSVSL